MPGFRINNIGGNGQNANTEARFYTSFTWEIPFIFLNRDDSSVAPNLNSFNNSVSSENIYDQQYQNILLKSAQLPSVSFNSIKSKGASIEYKYAGSPNFEPVKITWYDTVGIGDKIKNWSKRIWDPNLGVRLAESYKYNTVIRKFTNDYSFANQPASDVIQYTLYGSWPSIIKESDLTYSEASIKTIDVTLSYDYFVVSILDSQNT